MLQWRAGADTDAAKCAAAAREGENACGAATGITGMPTTTGGTGGGGSGGGGGGEGTLPRDAA